MPTFPTPRDAYYGNPATSGHLPEKPDLVRIFEQTQALATTQILKGFVGALDALPTTGNTTGDIFAVMVGGTDGGIYKWDTAEQPDAWDKISALPATLTTDEFALLAQAWAESDTSPDGEEGSKSSKTWALEAAASAALADSEGNATLAQEAAAQTDLNRIATADAVVSAEAARDATLLAAASSGYYATLAAGEAALIDGDTFWTIDGTDMVFYEIVAGTATAIPGARFENSAYAADQRAFLQSEVYGAFEAVDDQIVDLTEFVKTSANDLVQGREDGLFIDATSDIKSSAIVVKDLVTPANNFEGSPLDFFPSTTFINPKLCLQENGSLLYQSHNYVLRSEDFNTSWARPNLSAVAGYDGPVGRQKRMSLLTATSSTTSYITQNLTLVAGFFWTSGFVVKAGSSGWCYIEISDNAVIRRAYFNLATGVVGTVDAGLTAAISENDADGFPYNTGVYNISASLKLASSNTKIVLGVCNADASTAVTSGKTVFASEAHSHRGMGRVGYLPTTTARRTGVAYDWTPSHRAIRFDLSYTYKGRASDDLTNATYWTLANATAALDAVGPHGEPCSTLTSTVANGTVTQAVTSAGTRQMSFAWVRRKTGTGAVEMSADGGSTYKDVTDEIGLGSFTPVWVRTTVANPTVVFRLAESGDEIELALFNVIFGGHVPPAVPCNTADVTTISEQQKIPLTSFPSGDPMSVYVDIWYPTEKIGDTAGSTRIGFFDGNTETACFVITQLGVTTLRVQHQTAGLLSNFGNFYAGGRMQMSMRVAANNHALSFNGGAPWYDPNPGAPVMTHVGLETNECIWLNRMVVVPEAIDDANDDLRKFYLDADAENVNKQLLATQLVYRAGERAGFDKVRIPDIEVLYERGDVCGFITFSGEKDENGYTSEQPKRIIQGRFEFNRATNEITTLERLAVIYEPPGFASSLGGAQGYTTCKIINGPFRGRLVMVFIQQDSPTGTKSPDYRNIWKMYSDDNGRTWSAANKVLDLFDDFGFTVGFLATGENGNIYQMPDGRVWAALNIQNQNFAAMWCDDFKVGGDGSGDNWFVSSNPVSDAIASGTIGSLSEPAIQHRPDGSIVMFFRNTGGGDVAFSISTDNGNTWTEPVECAGDSETNLVNNGFIQDDPDGKYGRLGRFIIARSTKGGDSGHKVQSAYDIDMTLGNNYQLFDLERNVGYCPLKKAFQDDEIYLCHAEVQPTLAANVATSHMVVAFRYPHKR